MTDTVLHFIHVLVCENVKKKNITEMLPSVLAESKSFPSQEISQGNPCRNISSLPKIMAGVNAKLTMNF